jgi:signal peptidase I
MELARQRGEFDPAATLRRDARSSCATSSITSGDVVIHRLNVWKDELVAWFKTLASAAVYATLIVTFGFQVARVEGQSMAPTLADQDRLIVNKLAYRIGEPRRGDIVMLYYPINPDKSFVKRVIAEEGEEVRIVDGIVYVNDVPMKDDFVPEEFRSHDDYATQRVPDGYYFVMGDHRNNSSDSRHGALCRRNTSSARCSYAGGRSRTAACSDARASGVIRIHDAECRVSESCLHSEFCILNSIDRRYTSVTRVLWRVFFVNLARCRRQDRPRLRDRGGFDPL